MAAPKHSPTLVQAKIFRSSFVLRFFAFRPKAVVNLEVVRDDHHLEGVAGRATVEASLALVVEATAVRATNVEVHVTTVR